MRFFFSSRQVWGRVGEQLNPTACEAQPVTHLFICCCHPHIPLLLVLFICHPHLSLHPRESFPLSGKQHSFILRCQTQADFLLLPSHHISLHSQPVWKLRFILQRLGWFFSEGKEKSVQNMAEGRGTKFWKNSKKGERTNSLHITRETERQRHLDLSPRIASLCVITLYVYNILRNWGRFYLPLLNLEILVRRKKKIKVTFLLSASLLSSY